MTTTEKKFFHTKYRKVLKGFADKLGLKAGEFEVRSNMGGPAVLGEVILHTESLYVCVGGSTCEAHAPAVYYRNCAGRKDYAGGVNHWMPATMLTGAPERCLAEFRAVAVLPIKVKITKRDYMLEGVKDGTVTYHVMEDGRLSGVFSGCPLGRANTEAGALADMVRPGYALPFDTKITVADLEVVSREDISTAGGSGPEWTRPEWCDRRGT